MINKENIERLTQQVDDLAKIRDQILPSNGDLSPIFKEIDELYKKLLDALGYEAD